MDLPAEEFEYHPLPGPNSIRLLTIYPSRTFGDPIECKIEVASLNGSGRVNYVALSYSWGMHADGEALFNRFLLIHGKVKYVTQNLFEGILRLRRYADPCPLRIWIDAVCINQSNHVERTYRISRMRFVFEYAERTQVWLGEGDPDEDSVVLRCWNV